MARLNRIDLVSLRLFVAVVDAGSLTAGADRFGISLAATSKRIAELEQHCGIALLERGQRGVAVTSAGQTLHRHAIEVIARLEQLALAVDDMASGATGHLKLWANPSALGGFLPQVLVAYAQRYPNVRLDLEDALSEDAVRAVRNGAAELAVINDSVHCAGLETMVCNVDRLVLLARTNHPLASRSSVAIGEALEHELVMLVRGASLTRQLLRAAQALDRTLRIRMQVRSFDTMCRMVAGGLGAAILPGAAAVLYARALGLRIVRLEGPGVERRLLLAMRRRDELSPAALALLEMLQREVAAPDDEDLAVSADAFGLLPQPQVKATSIRTELP